MSNGHIAPLFRKSKTVTLSDTVENAVGSIGIHNQGAAGLIKVTYAHTNPDVDDDLYILQGEKLIVPLKRVWSTGTAVAEANIRLLMP